MLFALTVNRNVHFIYQSSFLMSSYHIGHKWYFFNCESHPYCVSTCVYLIWHCDIFFRSVVFSVFWWLFWAVPSISAQTNSWITQWRTLGSLWVKKTHTQSSLWPVCAVWYICCSGFSLGLKFSQFSKLSAQRALCTASLMQRWTATRKYTDLHHDGGARKSPFSATMWTPLYTRQTDLMAQSMMDGL